ncbi:ERCC1 protein, partial [Syrrhaptes paradoxus]|nr:ERCC1 protein [Syrrhaptes paradoxus]
SPPVCPVPVPQMTDCFTSVKSVNKTDTLSLLRTFGAKRLFDVLHEPFLKVPKPAPKSPV